MKGHLKYTKVNKGQQMVVGVDGDHWSLTNVTDIEKGNNPVKAKKVNKGHQRHTKVVNTDYCEPRKGDIL